MLLHARAGRAREDDYGQEDRQGSSGAIAAKSFDDAPAPSEIAFWMKSEFTGPWYAAYES